MIAGASGTADTPRAHLVNPFTLACLRDISVQDDAVRLSLPPEMIGSFRYARKSSGPGTVQSTPLGGRSRKCDEREEIHTFKVDRPPADISRSGSGQACLVPRVPSPVLDAARLGREGLGERRVGCP